MTENLTGKPVKKINRTGLLYRVKRALRRDWQLIVLALPALAFIIIFAYVPMYGAQIAFKKYNAVLGIWGSPWVGLDHFRKFFDSYQFASVLKNTLAVSFYSLIAGFPLPILLALALNCCRRPKLAKTVQMVTYAPYFISVVVLVGIVMQVLSPKFGIVNNVIKMFGGEEILFMATPEYFRSIYVWSGVWQATGWNAVIYISALSAVDPTLHEAAIVDGASRLKRVIHIDLPSLVPTIVIMLILSAGQVMNVGQEKVLLLQNDMNQKFSEVISTYIYKVSLQNAMPDFSYGTAIGLFNSAINLFLIAVVNGISKKMSGTGLF
ncbi:MAG: ABC transporter permease [Oscillospiraceae bacterium]